MSPATPQDAGWWARWRHRMRTQWHAALWLMVVWVLLWGGVSVANVLAGTLVGFLLISVMALPSIDYRGRVRPVAALRLLGFFVRDLLVASVQVSFQALRFGWTPHGAVVRVPMRDTGDLYLTVTSVLTSLVPGTVIVEAHRITGTLYVHVLDLESSGGADAVRHHIHELEERVLRALASDDELAHAGLGPQGTAVADARAVEAMAGDVDPGAPSVTPEEDRP
ncbi:multisubunit sodium/proton antiporter MrpE subunit [Sediminihabitans luteus]|uniref:Multisubunit sodium/proton antiporter MrpE subunit n=1 Tax=Sediminihabitans luteus TaxID=1138585 RepID=A0A2M9D0R5_9CELL|nr:Na+/H+ antiporter subunit E [Sediminihabitans luteus]PJJ77683.1 multisubunit sodium/proton antiporter MrpE subunit [Sediminihabitans luteus]GIJ00090.1 hypothetical protein Slu03_24670 [Sediminihabitans luteus]